MTIVTTRPNASIDGGGSSLHGAASMHAALSDDSDTGYIELSKDDAPKVGYAEPTIPSGGLVKSAQLRAKVRYVDKASLLQWSFTDPDGSVDPNMRGFVSSTVTWSTLQTVVVATDHIGGPHVTPTDIASTAQNLGDGLIHLNELYFDTIYVAKPTTNIVAPTGTLSDRDLPTVQWVNTLDSDGGPQTMYEVKIFTDAQHSGGGFDPTTTPPVRSSGGPASGGVHTWKPQTPLADGSYWSYVRVGQTVNGVTHWSSFDGQSFSISVARPASPTLTISGDNAHGRIYVQVDDNSGAATTDQFQVQVSDDGVLWSSLRTPEDNGIITAVSGAAALYDYEASNGIDRHYRARAVHNYAGNAYSAFVAGSGMWSSDVWWIKHPTDPALNVSPTIKSQPSTTRPSRQGTFQPLGAKFPIVVQDARGGAEGSIVFRFVTDADRDAFELLLETATAFLVQAPPAVVDWPDRWCAFGDYERERIIDAAWGKYSADTVQWTEVKKLGVDVPIVEPVPIDVIEARYDDAYFDLDSYSV